MGKRVGPKGGLILSSVFLFIGIGFMWLLCWAIYYGIAPYFWDKVECHIETSTTKTTRDLYHFVVEYTYEYERIFYVSDKVSPWYSGDSDYSKIQKLLDTYPEGSKRECYVNPDDPYDSVLKIHVEWILIPLMILPLAFSCVGFFEMLRAWKALSKPHWGIRYNEDVVFSTAGKWGGLVVSSIFLIPGILFFLINFLLPTIKIVSAQWWDKIPCTVISSRYVVASHDSDFTPNYAPDILYAYTYAEREYRSNDYDLFKMTSSDLPFIKGIVARYPPEAVRRCYVNTDRPKETVLYRGFYGAMIQYGLFPLPFIALGLYIFYRTFFKPVKIIEHAVQKVPSILSFFHNFFLIIKREYDRSFKKQ